MEISHNKGVGVSNLLKRITKKMALVGVTAALVGSAMTVGVFAAIPHSSTGVVTVCRTILTGAVRLIDAQAGASCTGGLESTVTWNSKDVNSAIAVFDTNPSDPSNLIFSPARSRNVAQAAIVTATPNPAFPENQIKSICMQVTFAPEIYSVTRVMEGINWGLTTGGEPIYAANNSSAATQLSMLCGGSYNVVASYNQGAAPGVSEPIKYFFSN